MPEIHHKKRKPEPGQAEDVIVKVGKLRIYFQNYYTLLSLANDILLGTLYFIGSLATLLNWPEWIRLWSYLAGAFFMLMRPLIKIVQNIFLYNKSEFQEVIDDSNILDNARND